VATNSCNKGNCSILLLQNMFVECKDPGE
jgi:hypothetical protein